MAGDVGQSQVAWMFFSQSAWSFPLGRIDGLVSPIGTTLVAADGLPLFSIPLKLLLPRALASQIQFFGPWLLFCFVAQAILSYRLVSSLVPNGRLRFLAVVILAWAPVMPFRQGHLALCGQWVILGVLDSLLRSTPQRLRWVGISAYACLALAVHAYLGAMAMGIGALAAIGLLWEHRQDFKVARYLGSRIAFTFALFGIAFWVLGYLDISGASDTEAFFYRADVLQFFNSNSLSSFVPKIRAKFHSFEAFAYMGLGPALLFFYFLWNRKSTLKLLQSLPQKTMVKWTGFACLALWFFSLGPAVCLGGNEILWLQWLYSPIWPLVLAFRCTGRFIWPMYYFLMALVLVLPLIKFPRKQAAWILSAVLVLQAIELGPWWYRNRPPTLVDWNLLEKVQTPFPESIRRIALVAPYLPLHGKECSTEKRLEMDWYLSAAAFAAQRGWAINSGSIGRFGEDLALRYCESELTSVREGLKATELYLVHPLVSKPIAQIFDREAQCENFAQARVCWKRP